MELIAAKDVFDIDYIPIEGAAGMVQSVLGGQVMAAYSGGIQSRYPGKFVTIAVTTTKRQAHYPGLLTLMELGYEGSTDAPTVIAFPKGTTSERHRSGNHRKAGCGGRQGGATAGHEGHWHFQEGDDADCL